MAHIYALHVKRSDNHMMRIGLTGGISSGKSTVSKMIKALGFPIIDADQLARDVVKPGENAYLKIVQAFGKDILLDDGTLNRKRLGDIIFSDETKRKQLNEIVHPEIRARMLSEMDAYENEGKTKAVVLDIPLLIESQLMHFVEKIILVYVDEEIQCQRLMTRDELSREEAQLRMAAQMSLKDKIPYADVVIDNNGSIASTKQQLRTIFASWNIIEG